MNHPLLFASSLLALLATTAMAEQKTVYRCGQTYQDSPCPGGKTIDVADDRSEAQRAAAVNAVRNEAELGSRLQRERLEREREQRIAGAANAGPQPKKRIAADPVPRKFKPKHKVVKTLLKPMPQPKKTKAAV